MDNSSGLWETEGIGVAWNDYESTVLKVVKGLFNNDSLADVTLICEGEMFKAHKFLLSGCSPFFQRLFSVNSKLPSNMAIVLCDMQSKSLQHILEFIYTGKAQICQSELKGFLRAGRILEIQGLDCGEQALYPDPEEGTSRSGYDSSQRKSSPGQNMGTSEDTQHFKRPRRSPGDRPVGTNKLKQTMSRIISGAGLHNVTTANDEEDEEVLLVSPDNCHSPTARGQEGRQQAEDEMYFENGNDFSAEPGSAFGHSDADALSFLTKRLPKSLENSKVYFRDGFRLLNTLMPYYEYIGHIYNNDEEVNELRSYPLLSKCRICDREIVAHRSHNLWNHVKVHGIERPQ